MTRLPYWAASRRRNSSLSFEDINRDMWEVIAAIATVTATLIMIARYLLIPAYKRFKSRPLSDCRIEQEIAEIVKRTGKYEFFTHSLIPISNELRSKFKDRLPEPFRSRNPSIRSHALAVFIGNRRGWTIKGAGMPGIAGSTIYQIIGYKVPYRYRRKSP